MLSIFVKAEIDKDLTLKEIMNQKENGAEKILRIGHLVASFIGIIVMASVAFGVLQAQVTANKEAIAKNEIAFRLYVKEQNDSIYRHIDDKFEGLEKYLDSEFSSIKQQVGKSN